MKKNTLDLILKITSLFIIPLLLWALSLELRIQENLSLIKRQELKLDLINNNVDRLHENEKNVEEDIRAIITTQARTEEKVNGIKEAIDKIYSSVSNN